MKKVSIIFSLLLIGMLSFAQGSLSSYIISIPEELLVGVNTEQKSKLVSSDTAKVIIRSILGEEIERTTFSKDYLALKTSEVGTLQIKLLPLVNNTDILGVITTVCSAACDSRIDFYTTSWEPLVQSDIFPAIDKRWFFIPNLDGNSEEFKNATAILDFNPIKLDFSSGNTDVTAEYDIESYLSGDDYKLLQPFLRTDAKIFKWDKLSYK